jgi:hypothetical protein
MEKPQNDGNYFTRGFYYGKEPIKFSDKGTIEFEHAVDIISSAGYRVLEKKFLDHSVQVYSVSAFKKPMEDYATQVIIETNPKITKKSEPVEELAVKMMESVARTKTEIDRAQHFRPDFDYHIKEIEKEKPQYLKLATEMMEAVKEEAKRIGLVEPKKSRGR